MSKISKQQAADLFLHLQGLGSASFGHSKAGIQNCLSSLSYVQIDTISVIKRAHLHTLWSRVEGFKEKDFDHLVKEKKIFEYWSHAAAYLPIENYKFTLPRKKYYAEGGSHWFEQDKKVMKQVLKRIEKEGPLRSKDFQSDHSNKGWFDWKPTTKALAQLFMEGRLVVTHREGFQKVYDLADRWLPEGIDLTMPAEEEYAEHLINSYSDAYGVISMSEVHYLRSRWKTSIINSFKRLVKQKKMLPAQIEGLAESFYISPGHLHLLENLKSQGSLHLLSPFDNLIIQRKRIEQLFNFDYIVECYVPAPKRKFGYYTLPILYNNQLVGRLDPKADRKSKTFYVLSIHFEKSFKPSSEFYNAFAEKLKALAEFNQCEKVQLASVPAQFKRQLSRLL